MIIGIIPTRHASKRFPGKFLVNIQGKTMIQRVYEQTLKATCLSTVIVATDDTHIYEHVQAFGGRVIMTNSSHPSGTDRCWEAYLSAIEGSKLRLIDDISFVRPQYIMNIQGDEPFINPEQIDELGAALDGNVELASQMAIIRDNKELFDEGVVKVIINQNFEAIYFSRQAISFLTGIKKKKWHLNHTYYRHVGLYAYRINILEKIVKLPISNLEQAESLEQLRWLQNGFKLKMILTYYENFSINTPKDLENLTIILRNKS